MMYILVTVNLIVLSVVLINWIKWRPISPLPHISGPCVSVLIPARNEEKNIACAIQSALEQGAIVQEILVYDDHSEDQTQPIVCALEKETPTLQLIEPAPLPDGWMGKPFACEQLSAKATGEWLLFLDADTRLHPGAAEAMLQAAETREATFLSCWPGILTGSFWEHIFMPMLNFVVYSIFPTPMQEKNPSPSFGLAHGACLFIHGKTYRATGGHASVKSELFEDTMLARTWRQKKNRWAFAWMAGKSCRCACIKTCPKSYPGFQRSPTRPSSGSFPSGSSWASTFFSCCCPSFSFPLRHHPYGLQRRQE